MAPVVDLLLAWPEVAGEVADELDWIAAPVVPEGRS
jgi:hypothetical protein